MAWERPGTIYLKPAMEIVADKLGIPYDDTRERFGRALAGREIIAFAFDEINDYFSDLPFSFWRIEINWNGAWYMGEVNFVAPDSSGIDLIELFGKFAKKEVSPLLRRPYPKGPATGKVMLSVDHLETWISLQLQQPQVLTTEPPKLIELSQAQEPPAIRPPSSRRGREQAEGDDALIIEMRQLIDGGKATSPWDAARAVADRASGTGSGDTKTKRLAQKYTKTYSGN